jgi:hypothetical protein
VPHVALPYDASRAWMERRILAGEPLVDRRHVLEIDTEALDKAMRDRVIAILSAVAQDELPERAVVLDSGVDPDALFGVEAGEDDAGTTLFFTRRLNEPIEDAIGRLPEVDEPTDDVGTVVAAWESWIERYLAEALALFSRWNEAPPDKVEGPGFESGRWHTLTLHVGHGITSYVPVSAGPKVARDALAAGLRMRYIERVFDPESVSAAREATLPGAAVLNRELQELGPDEIAACQLRRSRKQYEVGRAHHIARHKAIPDFDRDMRTWARAYGSRRLQIGIEDGYRMHALYLGERIAREAPGFYALPIGSAQERWASTAASPSENALILRRRVAASLERFAEDESIVRPAVKIVRVIHPPHQMYHRGHDGYPVAGWTWYGDEDGPQWAAPDPFEAVVVFAWLGRYHLVGAVRLPSGDSPPGIWATPDPAAYSDDGTVTPISLDDPAPAYARLKPPSAASASDDDIPF